MYKERIRSIYAELSPGYRRIADYLLNHHLDAAFMTAGQIAQQANVNTAQVVRLAQRLGFSGYPELVASIQAEVKREIKRIYKTGPDDDSPVAVLRRTLVQDQNNLEYILRHLEADHINHIVDILANARRIYVAGEGNFSHFAEALATRLVMLGLAAHVVGTEFTEQAVVVTSIQPEDAVVGLGVTGLTPSVATMLRIARDKGTPTIGVVGAVQNPVALAAEHVIHAPALTAGVLPSWTALAAVTHGLIQALAIQIGDRAAEWLMYADHVLKSYAAVWRDQIPAIRDAMAGYNPQTTVDGEEDPDDARSKPEGS